MNTKTPNCPMRLGELFEVEDMNLVAARQHLLPYLAAIFATCLMGSMGVFVRHLSVDAEAIAFARFGIGFLFLLGFHLCGCRFPDLKLRLCFRPLLSGLFIAVCVLSYVRAIQLTTLANAAFLLYLGPLLAVAVTTILFREKLSGPSALLLLSAFAGALLILGPELGTSSTSVRGNALAVLSALFYAMYIITNRRIPIQVSAIARAFYQLLVGAIVLAPFAGVHAARVVNLPSDWPWLLGLGFFQGFLSISLMAFSIQRLKAYQYSTIAYLEPAVAALAGLTLFGEALLFRQAVGGVIIIASGIAQTVRSMPEDDESSPGT